MQAVIYSNGSQECERAGMLLKSIHEDFHEYILNEDFTDKQFHAEFGEEAEYPQVSIGLSIVVVLRRPCIIWTTIIDSVFD